MADWRWTVSELEQALKDYIAIRRGLGFQLRLPAGYLRNFVAFLQAEGASHITTELALRWAIQPAKAQPSTWAWRLGIVRRFAAWLLFLKFPDWPPALPALRFAPGYMGGFGQTL
jgi:hypothetical protein